MIKHRLDDAITGAGKLDAVAFGGDWLSSSPGHMDEAAYFAAVASATDASHRTKVGINAIYDR